MPWALNSRATLDLANGHLRFCIHVQGRILVLLPAYSLSLRGGIGPRFDDVTGVIILILTLSDYSLYIKIHCHRLAAIHPKSVYLLSVKPRELRMCQIRMRIRKCRKLGPDGTDTIICIVQ
jgi:hypothetical protein